MLTNYLFQIIFVLVFYNRAVFIYFFLKLWSNRSKKTNFNSTQIKDEKAIELNDKKKRKGNDDEEKEPGVEQNKSKKKEQSVLQAKLTKLAIQIGYGGMTIAICTVIVLIVRFCIKEYGQDKKPLTPAIFNPLIKFLITGSLLNKNNQSTKKIS